MIQGDENLRKTFEATARYLSGKDVNLRFQPPLGRKGVWTTGEFYYDEGKYYIDINTNLNPVQACIVALHEIAHAKKHAHLAQNVMPRAMQAAQGVQRVQTPQYEDEADGLAEKWWKFATTQTADLNLKTYNGKAIAYMTALLFYKEN